MICVHVSLTNIFFPVLSTLGNQYTKEHNNFCRYQILVKGYGVEQARTILVNILHPKTVQEWLGDMKEIFRDKLKGPQKWFFKELYRDNGCVQLEDLDTTLLKAIFSKLPLDSFPAPKNGWNVKQPDEGHKSQAADLLRLFNLRNNLAHGGNCKLPQDLLRPTGPRPR